MAEQRSHPIREALLDVGALFIFIGGIALIGAGVEHVLDVH
jgi:hypothetical protein